MKEIKPAIEDLNNFFADELFVETKGQIKLSKDLEKTNEVTVKNRVTFGHIIAKNILSDPQKNLFNKIDEFIDEVEKIDNQADLSTLMENLSLDSVDQKLIESGTISGIYSRQYRDEETNITQRGNQFIDEDVHKTKFVGQSLFLSGGLGDKLTKKVEKVENNVSELVAKLKLFKEKINVVENKFGFKKL